MASAEPLRQSVGFQGLKPGALIPPPAPTAPAPRPLLLKTSANQCRGRSLGIGDIRDLRRQWEGEPYLKKLIAPSAWLQGQGQGLLADDSPLGPPAEPLIGQDLEEALGLESETLLYGPLIIAAAMGQGTRPYQEDCLSVHKLPLPAHPPRASTQPHHQHLHPNQDHQLTDRQGALHGPLTPASPASPSGPHAGGAAVEAMLLGHGCSDQGVHGAGAGSTWAGSEELEPPRKKTARGGLAGSNYAAAVVRCEGPALGPSLSDSSSGDGGGGGGIDHGGLVGLGTGQLTVQLEQPPGAGSPQELLVCGVYDGHGGAEVSRYCAKHMVEQLQRSLQQGALDPQASSSPSANGNAFPPAAPEIHGRGTDVEHVEPGKLESACKAAFLALDEQLTQVEHARELFALSQQPGTDPTSPPHEEVPKEYGRWGDDQHAPYIGPEAGSTATLAILGPSFLTVASVGDSRVLFSRSAAGGAQVLTRDHKPTDEEEESRIVQAGGWVSHSGRVNSDLDMSRSLGDMSLKQARDLPPLEQCVIALPDTITVELGAGASSTEEANGSQQQEHPFEYLLLCSDGLSNALTTEQVHELVCSSRAEGATPEAICRRLCAAACIADNTAFDNVSVLLVCFQ